MCVYVYICVCLYIYIYIIKEIIVIEFKAEDFPNLFFSFLIWLFFFFKSILSFEYFNINMVLYFFCVFALPDYMGHFTLLESPCSLFLFLSLMSQRWDLVMFTTLTASFKQKVNDSSLNNPELVNLTDSK